MTDQVFPVPVEMPEGSTMCVALGLVAALAVMGLWLVTGARSRRARRIRR